MPAEIAVTLRCESYGCTECTITTAEARGKSSDKVKFEINLPKGWMLQTNPYTSSPDRRLVCYCPKCKSDRDNDY